MAKTTLTQAYALELAIQIISECYSDKAIELNEDISIDSNELIDKLNSMLMAIKNKSHRPSKADTAKQVENDKLADVILETLMNSENPLSRWALSLSIATKALLSTSLFAIIVRSALLILFVVKS